MTNPNVNSPFELAPDLVHRRNHTMNGNEREYLRLLDVYTAGTYDVFLMAGSARASCRAHCMSVLRGRRVPQSQSGVNALREELFRITSASGDCLYACEESARDNALRMSGA